LDDAITALIRDRAALGVGVSPGFVMAVIANPREVVTLPWHGVERLVKEVFFEI